MKRTVLLGTTALAVVLAACSGGNDKQSSAPTVLQSKPVASSSDIRTVTGTATGRVNGTPDTLTMTIGVESSARSAREALTQNNDRAAKLIGVLQQAGVDRKDIQTSQLSITPRWDDNRITGYTVSNMVTVTVHALDKAGAIIDAAANVAGDDIRVNGVSFSIADTSDLVSQARKDAVKRARAQAQELADAADVELGAVQSITESTNNPGPVTYQAKDLAAEAAPIEPGTQELSVDVTVIFAIA